MPQMQHVVAIITSTMPPIALNASLDRLETFARTCAQVSLGPLLYVPITVHAPGEDTNLGFAPAFLLITV